MLNLENIILTPVASISGISHIIFSSYEPEPEFLKAISVLVNQNQISGSVPVSGWIIRFWSYPRLLIRGIFIVQLLLGLLGSIYNLELS
jgi:hypothetical protein